MSRVSKSLLDVMYNPLFKKNVRLLYILDLDDPIQLLSVCSCHGGMLRLHGLSSL